MAAADLVRALVVAAIALWPGGPPLGALALAVFAVGAGEAFFRPAETALIPSLLPADRLPQANGLVSVSYRTAAVIGPGLGGILVAGLGSTQLAFAANALAFLISMAFLVGLREPPRPARDGAAASSFVRDVREGLAEVRRHRWVAGTLVAASLLLLLAVAPLDGAAADHRPPRVRHGHGVRALTGLLLARWAGRGAVRDDLPAEARGVVQLADLAGLPRHPARAAARARRSWVLFVAYAHRRVLVGAVRRVLGVRAADRRSRPTGWPGSRAWTGWPRSGSCPWAWP